MFLLDVNVMFAALNEAHADHPKITRWLFSIERHASCGLTQIGTFRLLINPSAMLDRPLTSSDAHRAFARFTNNERHTFIPCPPLSSADVGQTQGYRAAFDDYLVQIANDAGYSVVTMDRALATRWPGRTFLIN